MKRATQLLATILMIVFTTSLSAQDMKPKKYDNPQWYHIVYIDYEAGTMAKAKQIIDDYYAKASEKSGTPGPVLALEMNTGEYDMMIVWHLTEGLDELNWEITANNIKWQKEFVKLAGSEEKAKEIRKEYLNYIKGSKTELARKL